MKRTVEKEKNVTMKNVKVNDIRIKNRFRKDMGDIRSLADSIKEHGLLQPIGITKNNDLVFGMRRIEAYKLLGRDSIEAKVVNVTSIIEGELTENEVRKQFTLDERVAIGKAVEDLLGERRGLDPRSEKFKVRNISHFKERTTAVAAQKAGFGSDRTYEKAKVISEKATDKQKERIGAGKSSIDAVYREIKRIDKKEKIMEMPQKELEGKYNVFLADPPWRYDFCSTSIRGTAEDHYPTMDIEEIKKLPVIDMVLDDAVLFLWTTTSMIRKAFDVIDAWGFEFKTSMVWVKQHIGTGFYVRSKHEIILIGTRGSFLPMTMDIPESVFFAPKTTHSKKPELIYEIIEKMYPEQRYIELFHRGEMREGWMGWGQESNV